MTVNFKKPLFTPSVVLVRGQVTKRSGRKLTVKGNFEDKDGNILATADGTWIMVNRDVGRTTNATESAKL